MSVFIRKGRKDATYSYEFQLQGRRFSGNTGKSSEREAKQVEKVRRKEAEQQLLDEEKFTSTSMTFEVAASRYWLEVGQHHKNSNTTLWCLDWLKKAIGAHKNIATIDDAIVASLVAKRRNEIVPNRKPPTRISPATVNRTMTQPLREIIIRADKIWSVKTSKIKWSEHLLKEPKERIREASPEEEAAIIAQLERGYDTAVKFAFLSGCRRMEIISLTWDRVDFFNKAFTVIGKGDKLRIIPMSDAIHDLFWVERNHHNISVFTFEAKRTDKVKNIIRGQRYPLTEAGLKTAMRRAVTKAGIQNFNFHDARHTAATRILRASNLRVAQKLLGHEDIKTTTKYAHALVEDIRDALNAISPTENPTHTTCRIGKSLNENDKTG